MWNDVLATESLVGEFSSHLYYGSSSDGGRSVLASAGISGDKINQVTEWTPVVENGEHKGGNIEDNLVMNR